MPWQNYLEKEKKIQWLIKTTAESISPAARCFFLYIKSAMQNIHQPSLTKLLIVSQAQKWTFNALEVQHKANLSLKSNFYHNSSRDPGSG